MISLTAIIGPETAQVGKEPSLLRPRQFSVTPVLACLMVALSAGCGLDKGFLNPGEVGRFKKEPLVLPVVSTLDTGIEEPNDLFVSATDIRDEDLVASQSDYVVGKNDLLTISITDLQG